MVLSPNERNKEGKFSHSMRRFLEVMNELGLEISLCKGDLLPRGEVSIISVCPI